MGNQGIIIRKVTTDKTIHHLNYFLKGASMIILMYLLNGIFIEHNFQAKDAKLVIVLYLIVAAAFLFIKKKRSSLMDNDVLESMKEYFAVAKFSDVEKLEKQLVKEIKNDRQFVADNGQVVGTRTFLLCDLADGQFLILPTDRIERMSLNKVDKYYVVNIKTDHTTEKLFFKKKKNAKEVVEEYQKNIVSNKQLIKRGN